MKCNPWVLFQVQVWAATANAPAHTFIQISSNSDENVEHTAILLCAHSAFMRALPEPRDAVDANAYQCAFTVTCARFRVGSGPLVEDGKIGGSSVDRSGLQQTQQALRAVRALHR